MLNVLIAILSETFGRCDTNKEEYAFKERVALMHELQVGLASSLISTPSSDSTNNLLFVAFRQVPAPEIVEEVDETQAKLDKSLTDLQALTDVVTELKTQIDEQKTE